MANPFSTECQLMGLVGEVCGNGVFSPALPQGGIDNECFKEGSSQFLDDILVALNLKRSSLEAAVSSSSRNFTSFHSCY